MYVEVFTEAELRKYRGYPCQNTPTGLGGAIDAPSDLCHLPSAFVYLVLSLDLPGMAPARQASARVPLPICLKHTREKLVTFDALVREGKIIIAALDPNMPSQLTCICRSCGSRTRFSRPEPGVVIDSPSFCPMCGERAMAGLDPDADYWEALATSLELPVDMTQNLHGLWLSDPEQSRSGKFVEWLKEFESE